MKLAAHLLRTIESSDRRMLGAFRCVDLATGLPIRRSIRVIPLGAIVAPGDAETVLPLAEGDVQVRQNRSGDHVLFKAPFFEAYTANFEAPVTPPALAAGPLRLRFGIESAGPHHLPRAFSLDLPRSLAPDSPETAFAPAVITLARGPGAPVQHGWAVLRVRVVEAGSDSGNGQPGVLLRAFRSPRAPTDEPIGLGLTEWRGRLRGEALVPLTALERFRPGAGEEVIESGQAIVLEAARLTAFTGAAGTFPDPDAIREAIPPDLAADPPAGLRLLRPVETITVHAGAEFPVELAMP